MVVGIWFKIILILVVCIELFWNGDSVECLKFDIIILSRPYGPKYDQNGMLGIQEVSTRNLKLDNLRW